MSAPPHLECPQSLLGAAMAQIQNDEAAGLVELDTLLTRYERDPRLHFLRGSVLAGLRRYDEARQAMAQAVNLAPDFHIARFQLGFLEFTSGNPAAAEAIWGPLGALSPEHPLRLFAEGLGRLARNDPPNAVAALRAGMALNTENLPLNRDMQLIIDQLLTAPSGDEGLTSEHHLLQQYQSGKTRH